MGLETKERPIVNDMKNFKISIGEMVFLSMIQFGQKNPFFSWLAIFSRNLG